MFKLLPVQSFKKLKQICLHWPDSPNSDWKYYCHASLLSVEPISVKMNKSLLEPSSWSCLIWVNVINLSVQGNKMINGLAEGPLLGKKYKINIPCATKKDKPTPTASLCLLCYILLLVCGLCPQYVWKLDKVIYITKFIIEKICDNTCKT